MPKYTNNLINETSPYLLQHAHNPVDWNPWNESTLETARESKKLILISVGYAACHWCHVMEHESFEDEEVAKIMNTHFVNIKVDREERPDVDQVYMNAVQLMTGSGGWPMNVVALPDGRPVWGGTYFKKEQWMNALNQIADLYANEPEKLETYATKLAQGMNAMDVVDINTETPDFNTTFIDTTVEQWSKYFDDKRGGIGKSPKFMMPNNYQFLMRYGHQNNDLKVLKFVNTTLTKMAYGGVYDQIGGGFSRYSVDNKWHVPHFEKMLYDNGQLVSLYSDAYALTKNELYKQVVIETLEFIKRELTDVSGGFYSSLDADSLTETKTLEEGAFYVWTKVALENVLAEDYELFSNYYNINSYGHWEHKNYVLIRKESDDAFISEHGITIELLEQKKRVWKTKLLNERSKRERPRLDDKILTSWNALMLKGYIDAYRVLGDKAYLDAALKNANFIINNQLMEDGSLFHNYKNGAASITGFLEDYATTTEAFIALYEVTLDEQWLTTAKALTDYSFDAFYNAPRQLFQFTSIKEESLAVKTFEYRDNVIPASNSITAKNLYKLSHYFENKYYYETATAMLNNVKPEISEYGSGFSNWLYLMLNYAQRFYEVAVVGKNAMTKISEINTYYLPNKIVIGSKTENELPLLKNRFFENETLIYVCENKACKLPTTKIKEAISLIKP